MSNTVTGEIYLIKDTEQISDTFKKRVVILEIEKDTNYPQKIKFELTQNNCEKADFVKKGQKATIHYNLRGRDYTNKEGELMFFTSLQAWKIEAEAVNTEKETIDNETLPF